MSIRANIINGYVMT